MRIEDEIKLDFRDVLIRPKRSKLASRQEVILTRKYEFRNSKQKFVGVPIMAANMDGVGTFAVAKALQEHMMFTCLVKNYSAIDWSNNHHDIDKSLVAISTGTGEKDYDRLNQMMINDPAIQFICIDVANGYSEHFGDFVAKVRAKYPDKTIIAGNVVTADMTQELILRGADIVKVGIGPGSVCTTRIQTGVGYPQLSAIIECADAAHGLGGHIIADGGCTCPGDVAKAFGAGADFVMLGSLLAGHDEGGGTVMEDHSSQPPKKFVEFYGMSSDTAMKKHHGGVADYRSSEGRTVRIPYKGPIGNSIKELLGGIRSACTYVGAPSLKQFSKCTTFIRVNDTHNRIYESFTTGK